MNRLANARRVEVIHALAEGNSVQSTSHVTGAAKDTVLKLLIEIGEFCSVYQDVVLRDLNFQRIEAKELSAYVSAKRQNLTEPHQGEVWTYAALDVDSKLIVSWLVGARNRAGTHALMVDVAARRSHRAQRTKDGWSPIVGLGKGAFHWNDLHFAQALKSCQTPQDATEDLLASGAPVQTDRAEPPDFRGADVDHASANSIERHCLNFRTPLRQVTRPSNDYSKKSENLANAISFHFMAYNFCRLQPTLTKTAGGIKTTPAIAAGVADHVWTVADILERMDAAKVPRPR